MRKNGRSDDSVGCFFLFGMQRGGSAWQHAEKHRHLQVRLQQHPAALPPEALSTAARHLRKHRVVTLVAGVDTGDKGDWSLPSLREKNILQRISRLRLHRYPANERV